MKIGKLILFILFGLNCSAQDAIQINSVLKQLDLDKQRCKVDLITSKTLPNAPEETVFVIPEIVEEDEYSFTLNSHILITDAKTGMIKYKYFEGAETNEWFSDAIRLEDIRIDSLSYEVSENQSAFGIMVNYSGSSGPNPYRSETISLYVLESGVLRQVLKNYVINQFNGEWDTNCAGEFTEQNKALTFTKELTNGYFDISVTNVIRNSRAYLDENNDCNESESIAIEKQILKYDNEKYKILPIH